MTIEGFFDKLAESTWEKNIRNEASIKIEQLISYLKDHQEDLVEDIVERCESMKQLKLEDNEEFNYYHFKKWLDYYAKSTINELLNKDEESGII